jgi:Tfp pilus assembly protein PilF
MAVNWAKTDADAMYKLGMAYMGAQQYEKAVNMFHGATTFVPNFVEAYDAMAAAYETMQKPELADFARGMSAYAKKDYTNALALLLKSSQAKSDFPPTFAGLGLTYEAMGDLQNAKISYETAVMLDQNNFTAQNGVERVTAALKK